MSFDVATNVLIYSFLFAFLFGAISQKTNFCTMGAVADWVNMGNTARLGAWFLAISVAIIGVVILENIFLVSFSTTIPPYRTENFSWLRYILGGLMFGVGMTMAGGCGNKTLVNLGAGSIRSLFFLFVASIMVFIMNKTSFYEVVFHGWISYTSIDLNQFNIKSQSIVEVFAEVFSLEVTKFFKVSLSLLFATPFLLYALCCKALRKNKQLLFAGISIGFIITMGWYITGGNMGRAAIDSVEWLDHKPLGVGVQSYTFINPMGELLVYLDSPSNTLLITFGLVALFGVVLGSFSLSIYMRRFSITGFSSKEDFVKHLIGAVLMGIGGVLAMGCTIGQGITGVSTLAMGSFIVLFSIILGGAVNLKVSYYKMIYEEASFLSCFISTLVDFKMLPESLRKLEQA